MKLKLFVVNLRNNPSIRPVGGKRQRLAQLRLRARGFRRRNALFQDESTPSLPETFEWLALETCRIFATLRYSSFPVRPPSYPSWEGQRSSLSKLCVRPSQTFPCRAIYRHWTKFGRKRTLAYISLKRSSWIGIQLGRRLIYDRKFS